MLHFISLKELLINIKNQVVLKSSEEVGYYWLLFTFVSFASL